MSASDAMILGLGPLLLAAVAAILFGGLPANEIVLLIGLFLAGLSVFAAATAVMWVPLNLAMDVVRGDGVAWREKHGKKGERCEFVRENGIEEEQP